MFAETGAYTPSSDPPAPIAPVPVPASQNLLDGAPLGLLVRLATPNAVAFFVQAAVGMAELAFVAHLGTTLLAALALMFPALMLMQMLANGAIGGAVASAVARALGRGDQPRAEALVWHALVIALIVGAACYLAFALFGPRLLLAMGATPAVTAAAADYAGVVFAGAPVLWVTALLSAVFRGVGNMRLPATLMVLGAAVQIPLAGALILGWYGLPSLGLRGAALAVISVAAINGLILLYRLGRGGSEIALTWASLRLSRRAFGDILRVGSLAALSPVFSVLTVVLVNRLVSGFGVAALAGYGIVARLEFLLIPLVFGLGAAMTALVGMSIGAGDLARAARVAWLGGTLAAVITGSVGLVLAVAPGLWLGLFTADPAVWSSGARYLHLVGPAFAFQGLGLSLYFASQGAGTVTWPVLATVLRFAIGVGGGAACVHLFGLDIGALYVCLALGMIGYGVVTAGSIGLGTWRRAARKMALADS